MRRFAKPKLAYDPEENLGRLYRDVSRISTAAKSRGGRLEAIYGHRALAVFEGDHCIFQALAAATEILVALSQRKSVFDEPEPPVVAVTAGTVSGGDQPVRDVAGLAVQQLESLIREAAPGEIYFSQQVHAQLAPLFQQAGIEVRTQRGLVSPQPLCSLSAELAGRVAGVNVAADSAAGFPDDRRSLSDLEPGVVLGGRFELQDELEASPMGPVFKARDRELGDLVILKALKPELVADPARFEWLRGIIRRSRAIRHPHVLSILDFGEAEGIPYISTEFERGITLRWILEQSRQVPLVAGVRLARQICHGLAAAHGELLLHRGLRPEKVLVEARGHARLTDVGLAPAGRAVAYLAPEQLSLERFEGHQLDQRADIYSLGVLLYEMFTGQLPYAGASLEEVLNQHLIAEPAPPSTQCEMPAELERVILRCLAKLPDQRYGTVAEVLADLDAVPV